MRTKSAARPFVEDCLSAMLLRRHLQVRVDDPLRIAAKHCMEAAMENDALAVEVLRCFGGPKNGLKKSAMLNPGCEPASRCGVSVQTTWTWAA